MSVNIKFGLPAIVLAPMEGITDAPMRAWMGERGGFSFFVSEFLRVSHSVPPAHLLKRHLPELQNSGKTSDGTSVQIQLLGGDPDKLAITAALAVQLGSLGVDINFGCPAPTVNRHDGGAAILRHPERIRSIVSAVRSAVPSHLPVSAKLRLGWDDPSAIDLNAEMAEAGGASWITIHGRTKTQGYVPPAYWNPIGRVRRQRGIPVIANGEIWTLEDFLRCRDETKCEHFMIGRGALADPNLVHSIGRELGLVDRQPEPVHWPTMIQRFAEIALRYNNRPTWIAGRIKQWGRYARRHKHGYWFDRIKTEADLKRILELMADPTGLEPVAS